MDKAKRKAIIAGNWKMNKTASEAAVLVDELIPAVKDATCEVVICTPFTDLVTAVAKTKGTNIHVGAENVHFEKSGAFTGEISADMLVDLGVEYVITGHSERRQSFAETDETVNKRTKAALAAGLKVIVCVGENLAQRELGVTEELVRMQTKIALSGVTAEEMSKAIDLGEYYRIPADNRDLNYAKYLEKGSQKIQVAREYDSQNTKRLDISEMKDMLKQIELFK